MFDLILVYFKGVYQFFEDLETAINIDCSSNEIKIDAQIEEIVVKKISETDLENSMKKIFGLKNISDCEMSEDI